MPVMPGGGFTPQSVLQGGGGVGGMAALSQGGPNPAAQVSAQPSAGPGVGGAATAEGVQAQLPQAQQAAGMAPAPPAVPPGSPGAPPVPGSGTAGTPGAPPPVPGSGTPGTQAPPPPMPGFVPNSQGQQLYAPGQGPITEQVPSLAEMGGQAIAAEPRGAMDVPLDANTQAGQMELQASAAYDEESVFETLGNVFGAYLQRAEGRPVGLFRAKRAADGKPGKLGTREHCEAGGLLTAIHGYGFQGANVVAKQSAVVAKQSAFPDRDRDDDDEEVEDASDLEDADDSDVYEPHHAAVFYDDNGKPRPSWKEGMARMSQLSPGREFTPGEDCAHCGVSMEKGDEGVCNRCGHDYDSGEDRKFGKQAVIGSHGVDMVSTAGDMRQSSAGEGDTSSLLYAPWTQNGADAWKDLEPYTGKGAGKGNSTFGGKLADKAANGDMLAFKAWKATGLSDEEADRKAGESLETPVIAKEKQARVEPLPRWAPPGPPRAFPGLMGHPGCQNFLASLGLGFDVQGFVRDKQAMLGDNGSHTPDPFGGGMILGQQQARQNPMQNPGTLLEAGADDSQEDTTGQPGDQGQHDATVAPYDALADATHVNGFKLGAFARGFVQHCRAEGLPELQICELAAKCATISEALAEELEPLTKAAAWAGADKWGPAIVQHGKRMLPFLGKAAPTVAPLAGRPGIAASASKMWQAASGGADDAARWIQNTPKPPPGNNWASTANAMGAGGQAATQAAPAAGLWGRTVGAGQSAYNAAYGARSPAYQLATRTALGAAGGTGADIVEARNTGSYEPTFALAGATGGLRPGGISRAAMGGGLGAGADYMTGNQYGFTQMGALGGAGSSFLPDKGLLGGVKALTNPASLTKGLSSDPWVARGQAAGAAIGGADLALGPIALRGEYNGATKTMQTAANELGVPTTDQKGSLRDVGDLARDVRSKLETHGREAGQKEAFKVFDGIAASVQQESGVDIRPRLFFDPKTGQPGFNGAGLMQEFQEKGQGKAMQELQTNPAALNKFVNTAADVMPELKPIAQQLGAMDANGQIDAQKLRQGMANFGQGGGYASSLQAMGFGWAVPMIDWAVQNPVGMAILGGGLLTLVGSLFMGSPTAGLLGAGAMALGASGYGDQLMGQAGQMLGFGKQQQPGAAPAAAQGSQTILGPLQAILPDVMPEELMSLLQEAGLGPDDIGPEDLTPELLQGIAGKIQAQRGQAQQAQNPAGPASDMATEGLSAGW